MKPLVHLAGCSIVLLLSLGIADSAIAQATFEVNVAPSFQPAAPGETVRYGVTVNSVGGNFATPIDLTCVDPLPTGVSCTFVAENVVPFDIGTVSILTVTTTASTPAGTHDLTIRGAATSGGMTADDVVQLIVGSPKDYTISLNPIVGTLTGGEGSQVKYTVDVTTNTGFTSAVTLACDSLPSYMDATCAFSPASVTPGNSSELTVTLGNAAFLSKTAIAVVGAPGGGEAGIGVVRIVDVSEPWFEVLPTPITQEVVKGSGAVYSLDVLSVNGDFNEPVSLRCLPSLPAGVSCNFDPAEVTPGASGASSQLTISTTDPDTPGGTFDIAIRGEKPAPGIGGNDAYVQLVVGAAEAAEDFSIAISPTSATVTSGSDASYTVTVTPDPTDGFSSSVSFACSNLPSGASCAFSPATVTPNDATVTTEMTVSTGAATAANIVPAGKAGVPLANPKLAILLLAFLLLGLTLSAAGRRRGLGALRGFLVLVVLIGVGAPFSGCGDSPSEPAPETTTFTVTASGGGLDRTATASITVNP